MVEPIMGASELSSALESSNDTIITKGVERNLVGGGKVDERLAFAKRSRGTICKEERRK